MAYLKEGNGFGFSQNELDNGFVTYERFLDLMSDQETKIYMATTDENFHGNFLFITASTRDLIKSKRAITFYGLGYDWDQEKWLVDEWQLLGQPIDSQLLDNPMSFDQMVAKISDRFKEIKPLVKKTPSY